MADLAELSESALVAIVQHISVDFLRQSNAAFNALVKFVESVCTSICEAEAVVRPESYAGSKVNRPRQATNENLPPLPPLLHVPADHCSPPPSRTPPTDLPAGIGLDSLAAQAAGSAGGES